MNKHSPDGLRMTIDRNGQVNDLARRIAQADELGRGLVTERRTGTGPQHGCPQQSLPAEVPGKGRVDTAVNGMRSWKLTALGAHQMPGPG